MKDFANALFLLSGTAGAATLEINRGTKRGRGRRNEIRKNRRHAMNKISRQSRKVNRGTGK